MRPQAKSTKAAAANRSDSCAAAADKNDRAKNASVHMCVCSVHSEPGCPLCLCHSNTYVGVISRHAKHKHSLSNTHTDTRAHVHGKWSTGVNVYTVSNKSQLSHSFLNIIEIYDEY